MSSIFLRNEEVGKSYAMFETRLNISGIAYCRPHMPGDEHSDLLSSVWGLPLTPDSRTVFQITPSLSYMEMTVYELISRKSFFLSVLACTYDLHYSRYFIFK
jgi:hypothetical protein